MSVVHVLVNGREHYIHSWHLCYMSVLALLTHPQRYQGTTPLFVSTWREHNHRGPISIHLSPTLSSCVCMFDT